MDIRYPVFLDPQEPKGFFVRFPDLEDTFTEGETEEEALFNASEVLTAMLSWRMDSNQPIPEPSVGGGDGVRYVSPGAKAQAALLLRSGMRSEGCRFVPGVA